MNARQRLITFITTYRDMLKVAPKTSAKQLCTMIGCDNSTGGRLIALGIVTEEKDGTHKWASTKTPDQIADEVIIHRRPPPPAPVPAALPSQASEEVTSLKRQLAELEGRVNDIGSRKPPEAKFGEDEAELLRMAINDDANANARIAHLEMLVGKLLVQSGGVAGPSPAKPQRLLIGVIGIYPRDIPHIQVSGTEIRAIEHNGGHHSAIPHGLDGLIVTDIAAKKWRDAQSAYPRSSYRVTGGNASIVKQIKSIAGIPA